MQVLNAVGVLLLLVVAFGLNMLFQNRLWSQQ